MTTWTRTGLATTGLVSIALLLPSVAHAQTGAVQAAAVGAEGLQWTWVQAPFADLWFHGLAVVGHHGSGPVPLYDPEYARRIRGEIIEGAGTDPSMLVRDADRLRALVQSDRAFDILHFVPLYFPASGLEETLDALAALAAQPAGLPEVPPELSFGVGVVAAALPEREQRETLGRWVDALASEWQAGFGAAWEASSARRDARMADLQTRWNELGSLLAPYLRGVELTGGIVLAVPSLGSEGRFFSANPMRADDNLVAVGLPTSDSDLDVAVAAAVREMCFPIVRVAFSDLGHLFPDRDEASRASDRAATYCGEWLLREHAPELLGAYRSRFTAALEANVVGGSTREREAYRSLLDALERELQRVSNPRDRSVLPDSPEGDDDVF